MLTADALVEAIYRAQHQGLEEDDIALTLMSHDGVTTLTLRQVREHLAVLLCREPRR